MNANRHHSLNSALWLREEKTRYEDNKETKEQTADSERKSSRREKDMEMKGREREISR